MEVFNIKGSKVEIIEQTPFKLEREIQDVIDVLTPIYEGWRDLK